MVKTCSTNYQPSRTLIYYNQLIRYIKIGGFLHIITIFGVVLFWIGFQNTDQAIQTYFDFKDYVWLYIMIHGFTLPFFSELDAYGRYQNYKLVKDNLFEYGYDHRLIRPFMQSKCQRDAVLVASSDLNCHLKVKEYFFNQGYRWHHIFPDVFVKHPLIVFKKEFWFAILFTKKYELKNFYW